MDLRFDGKTVLITGASTGIGAAAARRFAEAGASVGIHYHNSQKAAQTLLTEIEKAGGNGKLFHADLGQPQTAGALVGDFVAWAGKLDVLVNNAGALGPRKRIEQLSLDALRAVLALNVESVVMLTQAALPHLRKSKGNVVNVGSIAGFNGGGGGAVHYAAAKAAVHCLTIGWAKELAPDIRVNCIAPGIIATPFHEKFSGPEIVNTLAKSAPLGRAGQAEEMTGAILFLASDAASFITGEIVSLNGGMVPRM